MSCESCLRLASPCWQVALEQIHHGCDLKVRICTKHCVLSGWTEVPCAEKSRLALRAGVRRRRCAVKFVSNCARNVTEGSSRLFLFFVDAVLLCCAIQSDDRLQWHWLREVLLEGYCVFSVAVLRLWLCFARRCLCRSHWNGYIMDARCCGCVRICTNYYVFFQVSCRFRKCSRM